MTNPQKSSSLWLKLFDYAMSIDKLNRHAHKSLTQTPPPIPKVVANVQLPNIKLLEFEGDYIKWKTFWLSFEFHVHADPQIFKVSKYQFLACVVKGQALKVLKKL